MIFMWEWTDLQEGYQEGIGENKSEFSHFLALVFSVSAFVAVYVGNGEI